ncbi:hypothetical protein GIS00_06255 [Nakamurella sp. YIM 132087]|uniref:Uncharacterized protein n=1 Tax=Nakamurella alba TaxID=2665158 RepID=A0A7K1FHK5_9ACTN|nr:hypothetical protein [Nakamurella alba]MTD13546.1 hypothetical protein [Nakamurella alba]
MIRSLLGLGGRRKVPASLQPLLGPEERVLAVAPLEDGGELVATRFGLWAPVDRSHIRWDWALISKAGLRDRRLRVVVADPIGTWPDGTVVLADRVAQDFRLGTGSGLTDVVHDRVRRSVAASGRIEGSGGGWVVLRRVAGQDGLTVQYRPDTPGPPPSDALVALVSRRAEALRPQVR